MIMTGLYNMKEVPFRHVYLHGLIRDAKGRKMTKSLGNVVDPIKAIDQYGCDALRFVLATGGAPGNDFRLTDERLEGGRNFANKIWNASRFVLSYLDEHEPVEPPAITNDMPLEDRWIMSRLQGVVKEVDRELNRFRINEAAHRLHEFFWSEYCDVFIERAKVRLKEGDTAALSVVAYVLERCLRLLHPFMPFVTERLWQHLREHVSWADGDALIVADWPQAQRRWVDRDAERNFLDVAGEPVPKVREAARRAGWSSKVTAPVSVAPDPSLDAAKRVAIYDALVSNAATNAIVSRTASWDVRPQLDQPRSSRGAFGTTGTVQFYVPPGPGADSSAERARLSKQMAEAEGQVKRLEGKLANKQFREKAPAAVVAKEEERLVAARARLEGLRQRLAELG
jgi:valyl-tRNA synthetase